jgi:hypothetical protein
MSTRLLLSVVSSCAILHGSAVLAAEPFGPTLEKQPFAVLRNGASAVLGAEISAAAYRKQDTQKALEEALANLSEAERLRVPEYLIVKQYKMILAGDLKGILADYKNDEDKQAAQKQFRNLREKQKYCRENTRGIEFKTKCQFGPWVRIRYKQLAKDPKEFSMPWALWLRKDGDRCYFVKGPAEGSIYHTVAEAWPYWKPRAERGGDLLAGLDAMTILPDDAAPEDAGAALKLYYKLEAFPAGTLLLGEEPKLAGRQLTIWRSLKKVAETYRTEDRKAIFALWDEERRKLFEADADLADYRNPPHDFWRDAKDASPYFLLDAGEYQWIYVVPQYAAKAGEPARTGKVKLLSFHSVNGRDYLTDAQRFMSPPQDVGPMFANDILRSPEFRHGLGRTIKR